MANIVRWEPFREILSLRHAMDRLFGESFIRPTAAWNSRALSTPAVDVYQNDDEVVVKATLPGVEPDDIHINVTGDVLSIEGEVKDEVEKDESNYIVRERHFGHFRRQLALPTTVESDKANAEFEHGVLTLKLPKAEVIKPKQISVKAK